MRTGAHRERFYMVSNTISKVSTFIQELGLPEGITRGLLVTVDDCNEFYINFYGKGDCTLDDLLDYKEYRINISEFTLDSFLTSCYNIGRLETFELAFFQSFTEMDMVLVDEAIDSGRMTLEGFFMKSRKNPSKNVLKYVL